MSDVPPDIIARTEAEAFVAEAVTALGRELRAEFALALTPAAPAEDEGSASNEVALAAYALSRGHGSAAEFMLAARKLFGPHTATVLDAARRLGPQPVQKEAST